jgi:tetratricopeptide (TPR) repeat protein
VTPRLLRYSALALVIACAAVLLPSDVAVWVDGEGHTWLTDREESPSESAQRVTPEELAIRWDRKWTGEPLPKGTRSGDDDDRYLSEVRSARADAQRGNMELALRSLRRLQRDNPNRPEAALLLAQIERHRGRYEPAREALDAVLSTATPLPKAWRDAAERERAEISEELALAKPKDGETWQTRSADSAHFRVTYDHQFAGRAYGEQVLEVMEQARQAMLRVLGRELREPLEVKLYTRAHYLEAYRHRFGFATVGFYDGAIHVVSARRPRNELYALVVHEYAHALFKDAVGTHQPFFLNEGIADGEEERARGRPQLSREEWRRLLDALRSDSWIPLESLVQGFSGVQGSRALLAYLESRAAIEHIEDAHPRAIPGFLSRCANGQPWESALRDETGWDVAALERSLKDDVRSRFPEDPLAAAASPTGARSE